jgi:hypothetical protein
MNVKSEIVMYYIYKKKLSLEKLKKNKQLSAFIEVVFQPQDKNITIINLQSKLQGKEYATHLILHICKNAKNKGISTITLDDCSDRYRSDNNLYTKIGMTYDNEDGGPEMSGKIDDILKYRTLTETPTIYFNQE